MLRSRGRGKRMERHPRGLREAWRQVRAEFVPRTGDSLRFQRQYAMRQGLPWGRHGSHIRTARVVTRL